MVRYSSQSEWVHYFLNVLVDKNINSLSVGGHLVLYVPNYPGFRKHMKELENRNIIKNIGIISYKTDSSKLRDIYVWKKLEDIVLKIEKN